MPKDISEYSIEELIKALEFKFLNRENGGSSTFIPYTTTKCEIRIFDNDLMVTNTKHYFGPGKILFINNITEEL